MEKATEKRLRERILKITNNLEKYSTAEEIVEVLIENLQILRTRYPEKRFIGFTIMWNVNSEEVEIIFDVRNGNNINIPDIGTLICDSNTYVEIVDFLRSTYEKNTIADKADDDKIFCRIRW